MADVLPGKIVGPAPPPPADTGSSIPPPDSLPGRIVGRAGPVVPQEASASGAGHFDKEGGFHLFGTSTEPMGSFFGSTVAPAINIMDYPIRAAIGDLAVAASIPGSPAWFAHRWGLGPDVSPEKMQKLKEQIIDAGALPETRTGKAIEEIASLPGTLISKGVGAASRKILGPQLTEQLSPYAQAAADVLPFGAGKFLSRAPKELPLKPSERWAEVGRRVKEKQDIANENRARKQMSDAYERSTYEGGGRNTQDILDEQAKARAAGQPLLAADLNDALKRLGGTIYRQGGAAAARVRDFFEGRDKAAAARMDNFLDQSLTDQSLRDTMKAKAEERSANARPLWSRAMERGTSTAIFERKHTLAWQEASKKEAQAQAALAAAEKEAKVTVAAAEAAETQRRARQITTTPSFEQTPMRDLVESRKATAGADQAAAAKTQRAQQTAAAKVVRARAELEAAQKETAQVKDLMRRAQEDGTLNAPGATWSLKLQRALNAHPEIRAGINRGIQIMRLESTKDIMDGKPFNPRDYAIVGVDAAGEPVIGAVPTMRLWHAAKVGLDQILRDAGSFDPVTGRPTQFGRAVLEARKELVTELDKLNKHYKPARDQWAGETSVMRALGDGKSLFKEAGAMGDTRGFMDDQHVREHFESLGDSEKQAFITGVRQELENRMDRLRESQDQSTPFSTQWVRKRLAAVLGPAADEFLAKVEREHQMKVTSNETLRGSPTAPRLADDAAAARDRMNVIRRVAHDLRSGGFGHAGAGLLGQSMDKFLGTHFDRAARARQDIVNDIMARHLIDPNLALNPTGPLLSPVPTPPRTYPTPAMAYTFGTSLMPEDRSKHP